MAHETLTWLNTDFTERVLRFAELDSTIHVTDIISKPATAVGDNYASDLVRVVAEFTRKEGKTKVKEKKSLLFKFEPIAEGPRKEMIMDIQIFDFEIFMMTNTLRKMNKLLDSRLSAHTYYIKMERPMCLILEDLAPLGFRMANRQLGLDMDHCILAIQGLARFHAASVALCEKEPKQKELYWKGMFNEANTKDIVQFFKMSCISLARAMESWPQNGKRYAEKVKNFSEKVYIKGLESMRRKDDEFNVINHGDAWTNNMMFRYDKNDKPIDHIFVDFQISVYTSPAIDLLYFLNTSINEEISNNGTDSLVEEYQRTLVATMKKIGCKTQPPTLKEIKKYMSDRLVYGMISSMNTLPFALVDKKDAQSLDSLLENMENYQHPGYNNPLFQRILLKRLEKFEAAGLLD
ncbi:uncharacterized protein isoform X1 [Bombus fervidus]|uniref:uncharacterized protein isoform X1 n=2 Tax=Bombus fervidus TaxID=203811 RepID=UPI003AB6B22E